jgi:hypothetical protein
VRDATQEVVRNNKQLKAELGMKQQALRQEEDIGKDNKHKIKIIKKNLSQSLHEIMWS